MDGLLQSFGQPIILDLIFANDQFIWNGLHYIHDKLREYELL